jgi:hypothetical protein
MPIGHTFRLLGYPLLTSARPFPTPQERLPGTIRLYHLAIASNQRPMGFEIKPIAVGQNMQFHSPQGKGFVL